MRNAPRLVICEDCKEHRLIRARGRCTPCYRAHLKALKANASYVPLRTVMARSSADKVLANVVAGWGGCWIFTGHVGEHGYAVIKDARTDRCTMAHRATYEALVGPIPEGLELDHTCRVRRCVNPAHLEPVTGLENRRRAVLAKLGDRTHCSEGHELTEENTVLNPRKTKSGVSFSIVCRQCKNAYYRDWSPRNRKSRRRPAPTQATTDPAAWRSPS